MSIHRIEFEYDLPESDIFEMDIDPALDQIEKEAVILSEIKKTIKTLQTLTSCKLRKYRMINPT